MVLVAGYSPLDEGRPFSQADLDKLEAELISLDASKKTMDFIYRLLILDEGKRMNVKQALQHDWLTDPRYKPDLDKLYQRAIQDWVPRRNEPTIVDLKVMNAGANFQLPVQNPVLETRPDLAVRPSSIDHVSESSLEAIPVKNSSPFESPTISDVFHFNSYSRERKQPPASNHHPITQDHDDEVPNQHENTSKKRHIFLSGCVSKNEQVDKKLEKQFLGTSFKMAEIRGQKDIRLNSPEMTSQARKSDVNLKDIELSLYDCKFSPSKPHRDHLPGGSGFMCDRNKIQTQAEKCSEKKEEVYEVVQNHFTGKKRRYIYGRDVDSIVEIS